MAAAVATLNSYTKTLIEMKHRAARQAAPRAPSYHQVVLQAPPQAHAQTQTSPGTLYSVSRLLGLGQQGLLFDPAWPRIAGPPAAGPLASGAGGALPGAGGAVDVGSVARLCEGGRMNHCPCLFNCSEQMTESRAHPV